MKRYLVSELHCAFFTYLWHMEQRGGMKTGRSILGERRTERPKHRWGVETEKRRWEAPERCDTVITPTLSLSPPEALLARPTHQSGASKWDEVAFITLWLSKSTTQTHTHTYTTASKRAHTNTHTYSRVEHLPTSLHHHYFICGNFQEALWHYNQWNTNNIDKLLNTQKKEIC